MTTRADPRIRSGWAVDAAEATRSPLPHHLVADLAAPVVLDGAALDGAGPDLLTPDLLTLVPGRVVGLIGSPGLGLTRLGLAMLAGRARHGPVAYVDVRGWLCPSAAWEVGIDPERLIVVRCADPVVWGRVVAVLLDGLAGVFAEVPGRVKDAHLRTLAAATRSRSSSLVLRPVQGGLPGGVTHLQLEGRRVRWEGTDRGHGRLGRRLLVMEASGKAMRGMERIIEVEDHGTDAVRLVPGVGAAPVDLATG